MHKLMSVQFYLLIIRLGGAGTGLLFQILLARVLRPSDLGTFFAATSLASILGIVAAQGYPNIAARFISRYSVRGRDKWLSLFFSWTQLEGFRAAISIGAVIVVAAVIWPGIDHNVRLSYIYAGIGIPATASLATVGALGVAQKQFIAALLPELLIRPVILALLVGGILLLELELAASDAVLAFVGITVLLAAVQGRSLHVGPSQPRVKSRLSLFWQQEAWTLLVVMLFTSFFADFAIISAAPFIAGADLAAFGVSIKIAMIVGFGVQVAHQVILPDLSDAYARRQEAEATFVLLRGASFPILFSGAAVVFTALLGPQVLSLFGSQFTYASGPLLLLVSCQFLRALGGPSQSVLTLEGRQKTNLLICSLACLVLVCGNIGLAGTYGLWGAAIATAISYSVWIVGSGIALHGKGLVQTDIFSVLTQYVRSQHIPKK